MSEHSTEGKTTEQSFPGKIAIITNGASLGVDIFCAADQLIEKYGAEKIIHVCWPEDFMTRQDEIINMVARLAEDMEIKVLILNQAIPGTNAAIDKFRETRNDVFIIYCIIHESISESSRHANLILELNELDIGSAMVKQAKKQGAKVFVHYSSPRHMALAPLAKRRDLIRDACMAEGIQFVHITAPDPAGPAGLATAQQFILDEVPKLAARYGEDTAFFATKCALQAPLIKAVVDCHAIYPQPCCPSPFHGFPEALGIKTGEGVDDLKYIISEACRIAAEKDMTDRLSTWPVSASMMFTNAGAEYAIKWINGEVSRNRIDSRVLEECMSDYIKEVVGEGIEVEMNACSENGISYDNFKLILMSYLDF